MPGTEGQGLIIARVARAELAEHFSQRAGLPRLRHPVTLAGGAGVQAMVLLAGYRQYLHVPLDGGDRWQETLTVEAVAVKLLGWLVGGGDKDHTLVEQHLEQAAENDCIANVADEQLVETQHADLRGQLPGQRQQRVCGAVEQEQALVDPGHEMVEVLAPTGNLQAPVKLVHQPGLATADRAPEVDAEAGAALFDSLEARLQSLDGTGLGRVGDIALGGQGLLIEGVGIDSHAAFYTAAIPRTLWKQRSYLIQKAAAIAVGAGVPANTGEARAIHRGACFAGTPAPTGAAYSSGDQASPRPTLSSAPSLSSVSTYR